MKMTVAMIAPTKALRVRECPISEEMKVSAASSPMACHGSDAKSIGIGMRTLLSAGPKKARPYQIGEIRCDDNDAHPLAPMLRTPGCIGQGETPCPPSRLGRNPRSPSALPGYNINKAPLFLCASCAPADDIKPRATALAAPSGGQREGNRLRSG